MINLSSSYNPDVLSCIANLSNDEVFTPPEVANAMLDMLPQELFSNPSTTFLDPATKSGVFLREIAKRLLVGLEPTIPDLQERLDHIFQKQLFGIAITEITSLLSRRSLYCSKYPNSIYSVSQFDNVQGNIRFRNLNHRFKNSKCVYCGAAESEYGEKKRVNLEKHAYEFIHNTNPKEIFDMKFDVIIGNPPYQLSDGGAQASAIPIYNKFVNQAKKLNPHFLCMIIPARWMTGGRGLDSFRDEMIHDDSIKELHDFTDASECFSGVEIKGGVCYFLRDREYHGKCKAFRHSNGEVKESFRMLVEDGDSIFIRDDRLIPIKNKIMESGAESFESIVSSMRPYGLRGDFYGNESKYDLPKVSDNPTGSYYRIVGLDKLKRKYTYAPKNYPLPKTTECLNTYKIFITRNWGIGSYEDVPSMPIIAEPRDICTETFIEIGPFATKEIACNVLSYISTKFFRVLVAIRKQDQGASKAVYHYVPLVDFNKKWTDEELYKEFKLNDDEIEFIESVIKPMELSGD